MSSTASPRAPRARVSITSILTGRRARGRESGRDVRGDLAQDGFLAPGAHDASLFLAVLEEDERRYAHHAVLPGGLGIVVHVELGGGQAVRVIAGDGLHDGGDH